MKSSPRSRAKARRTSMARRRLAASLLTFNCAFNGCGKLAVDLHEPLSRARGGDPADPANMEPLCREHHDWIGGHPAWARRHGWLISAADNPDRARYARKMFSCDRYCPVDHLLDGTDRLSMLS